MGQDRGQGVSDPVLLPVIRLARVETRIDWHTFAVVYFWSQASGVKNCIKKATDLPSVAL